MILGRIATTTTGRRGVMTTTTTPTRRRRATTRGGTDGDGEEHDYDEGCDNDGEERDDDNKIIINLIIIYSICVRCQSFTLICFPYVGSEKLRA